MQITSSLKDQSGFAEQFVVLDSMTPVGTFHVGAGVGRLEKKNLFLTEVGKAAFERLNVLSPSQEGKIHLVEVVSVFKAKKIIPDTFLGAKSGDAVFFICKDSAVYDAVFAKLGLTGTPTQAECH